MCPTCGQKLVQVIRDFAGTKYHGVECHACGWKRTDKRAHRYFLKCHDCRRKMGYVYHHEDMTSPKSYVCAECSVKHLATNNPRPVKVRFEVVCSGTCGKVIAWNDHLEGRFVKRISRLSCLKCKRSVG